MIVISVGTIVHVFWCYLFVTVYEMDIYGVSLASFITYSSICAAVNIYAYMLKDIEEAWFRPGWETFNNLGIFMKLSIPSMLMLCLEMWTFEILTLFAGYISVDTAAA